jgi:hypothetical protein
MKNDSKKIQYMAGISKESVQCVSFPKPPTANAKNATLKSVKKPRPCT